MQVGADSPLCRPLLGNDAGSTMADLAGADAEVSLVRSLLPTLSGSLETVRWVLGLGVLTERFRRPCRASMFLTQNKGCLRPKATSSPFLPLR